MALSQAPSRRAAEPGRYERDEPSLRIASLGVAAFALLAAAVLSGMWLLWTRETDRAERADQSLSAARPTLQFAAPPLQPSPGHDVLPREDLAEMRAREDSVFSALGWKTTDGAVAVPEEIVRQVQSRQAPNAAPTRARPTTMPVRGADQGGAR